MNLLLLATDDLFVCLRALDWSSVSVEVSLTVAQKRAASLLVKAHEEHSLDERIIIYFDPEYLAIYPMYEFREWLFIAPVKKQEVIALANIGLIGLEFDTKLGMDVIAFKPEIFTAVKTNFAGYQATAKSELISMEHMAVSSLQTT